MATSVKEENSKRNSGRPRTAEGRRVYEALLCAAERCVQEHGTADVSATQIARAAGATDKMINYYFGSKEHLMFLIMKRAQREFHQQLNELEATLLKKESGNPTWRLVKLCVTFAKKHGVCARLFPIRDRKLQREFYILLQPTTAHVLLSKTLHALVAAGIYSPQLDLAFATFTLGNLMSAPSLFAFALPMHDLTLDDLESDAWITHVASMLDQQFRNPQRLTAGFEFEPADTGLEPRFDRHALDDDGEDAAARRPKRLRRGASVSTINCVQTHKAAAAKKKVDGD